MLLTVGQKVKINKVAPVVINERGDVEIKDYVVLTHGQDLSSIDVGCHDDS